MAKQLAERILEYIDKYNEGNSLTLSDVLNEDHQKIIGAIKSIESLGADLITTKLVSQKSWELTTEGEHIIKHGSHEAAVYNAVPEDGISQSEIIKNIPFAKVGFSKAIVAGWIVIDKSSGSPIVRKKVSTIHDSTQENLKNFNIISDKIKEEYKKRKLLQEVTVKSVFLQKGPNFSLKIEKQEAEITAELLTNGSWKEKTFKPYNFDALGSTLDIGHLHPLLKVRSEFRKIFIEMGFIEMPTNNYVESSFWNFDALFQPQQHPARDAHDTFFLSKPRLSKHFPEEYLEKVKKVHSIGDYGSQGYGYDWKLEEAQKNLLRTHTTAVSARMLYKLMQQGEFKPSKFFSIDRVFRNETLDATHLAEFHQVEGVVAGHDITLGDLIGLIYEFFKKLGITQLEFKPAYNPYTEPSMEIFCFHNGLNKWIEIGNSGMFRPEMLLPMGIPENVNVLGFGLSLERPTMIKYGINNIRDLVGPKVDMELVHNNPLCRLDKISRQSISTNIIEQTLHQNCDQLIDANTNAINKNTLIIFCDPNFPIYSLETLFKLAKSCLNIQVSVHSHSSIKHISRDLMNFCYQFWNVSKDIEIRVTLIWKYIGIDPILIVSNTQKLIGEITIARYINRLIELKSTKILIYESNGPCYANEVDKYLDMIYTKLHEKPKKVLSGISKKSQYVIGDKISIVDIIIDSFNKRLKNL